MVDGTDATRGGFQLPDVLIVGAGLAALTTALACARRGLRVDLVGPELPGNASDASAGVLAPSVGRRPSTPAQRFLIAARDQYPAYLRALEERTPLRVPFRAGVLEVACTGEEKASLYAEVLPAGSRALDADEVGELEPELRPMAGGIFHEHDAAVQATLLVAALRDAVARSTLVRRCPVAVVSLEVHGDRGVRATLADGDRVWGRRAVLAAGVWAPAIAGLPHALRVRPLTGEVAFTTGPRLHHTVFGAGGYLVPRPDELLVGATSESRGLDASFTDSAARALDAVRATLLRDAPEEYPVVRRAAGLRPMTPDALPIIGPAADEPALLHACGYSRNGVLVAPLAAECLAAIASGESPGHDLTPFSPDRFRRRPVRAR